MFERLAIGMDAAQERPLLEDPGVVRRLLSDTRLAGIWTVVRLYAGWQWLEAGRGKLSAPGWMDGGETLRSYWQQLVTLPAGSDPALASGRYRDVIQSLLDHHAYGTLAPVIAVAQTLVGVALILGALTALAACAGVLMSFSLLLPGAASVNPAVLIISLGLILGWKTAGWIGFDRWLLPMLGAPWSGGQLFERGGRPLAPLARTGR